jgi:hypothetical protein
VAALAVFLHTACGDDGGGRPGDGATPDGAVDAGVDGSFDGSADAGVDGASDGSVEEGDCIHFDDLCPDDCTPMDDADCAGPPPTPVEDLPDILDATDYATVVYIDPSHSSPGDGSSPDSPLASWAEVTFQADTAYLQKRATTDTQASGFQIQAENVLVGAYGQGERPALSGPINVVGDRVTVRDLEIDGGGLEINHPSPHPLYTVLFNNEVHGAGISSAGYHFRILNNEVHHVPVDAIFVQYARDFEIAGNYIHHVNQVFHQDPSQDVSAGDAIQLDVTANWWVHHNVLDRTDTGNKFCFISTRSFPDTTQYGTVEYNTMSGPLETAGGGASLFLGGEPEMVHVRYNIFVGPSPTAVYKHSPMHFYGNVVDGTDGVSSAANVSYVYNNVFTNTPQSALGGGQIHSFNNIFDDHDGIGGITAEGSNLFVSDYTPGEVFVDPQNGDYRPAVGSPAVDGGSWQSIFADEFTADAYGSTVPHDQTIDIGAFQLQ